MSALQHTGKELTSVFKNFIKEVYKRKIAHEMSQDNEVNESAKQGLLDEEGVVDNQEQDI